MTNTTRDVHFWLNAKPRFEDRSESRRNSEIQLSVMDRRQRPVPSLCSDLRRGPEPSDFRALPPGQTLEVIYTFDPGCYSLAPNEELLVQLSYAPTDDWRDPEPGSTMLQHRAVAADWHKLVVPPGWKDTLGAP